MYVLTMEGTVKFCLKLCIVIADMPNLTKQKTVLIKTVLIKEELMHEFDNTLDLYYAVENDFSIGDSGTHTEYDETKLRAWLSQALDTIASAAREEERTDILNRTYEKVMKDLRSHLKEKQK